MIKKTVLPAFLAVFAGLLVGGVIILCTGQNPLKFYAVMATGSMGDLFYFSATLARATPIIFGALAVCLAWKAGYTSIGMEGQMILSALSCAVLAVYTPGPGPVKLIVALLGGLAIGAAYSLLAGWLQDRFQVALMISTLLMNYVASFLASYFVSYVFKDPYGMDSSAVQTEKILDSIRLPKIFGSSSVHLGFLLALAAAAALWFVMMRTRFGYQARMCGLNPSFSRYGGVQSTKVMYLVLILSGAVAGMGGICEVLGTKGRYVDSMITSPAYAWTGMVAALMANYHPVGAAVCSVFLAALATGGNAAERTLGIPVEITSLIQGVITLFMSAKLISDVRKNWKRNAVAGQRKETA